MSSKKLRSSTLVSAEVCEVIPALDLSPGADEIGEANPEVDIGLLKVQRAHFLPKAVDVREPASRERGA